MSYVLFHGSAVLSFFLFDTLQPSDQSSVQKSSSQPFVTEAIFDSTSECSASLASFASLKQITSTIMPMASAFKAAQDAPAVSADHPHAQDDVIMLSADPILIVNSQNQEALDAAHVRNRDCNVKPHNQGSLSTRLVGQVCCHGFFAELKDGHVSFVR